MGLMHSLNKIADVLQVPITCTQGVLGGGGLARLKLFGDREVSLWINPVAIFKNNQVGIVVHILGDLYLMVSHYEKTEALSAYVLDKKILDDWYGKDCVLADVVTASMSVRDAIAALGGATRASYYRKDGGWKPLVLPK